MRLHHLSDVAGHPTPVFAQGCPRAIFNMAQVKNAVFTLLAFRRKAKPSIAQFPRESSHQWSGSSVAKWRIDAQERLPLWSCQEMCTYAMGGDLPWNRGLAEFSDRHGVAAPQCHPISPIIMR